LVWLALFNLARFILLPEGKQGTRTLPLDLSVSQTTRQKSAIMVLSGCLVWFGVI
jgi:hypothetical protein